MCGFPSSECVNKFFIFRWRFGGDVVNGLWYYSIRYSTQLNLTRLNLWYFHWVRLVQEFITIYHHTFGNKATHKRTTTRYDFFCAKFCSLSFAEKVYEYLYRTLCAAIEIFVFTFNRIRFIRFFFFLSSLSRPLYPSLLLSPSLSLDKVTQIYI